jgi:diketogulonate reductase-like aldo/keto reductase
MRLAFRYGIRTLDTSPYYTTSERVREADLELEMDGEVT